jgi:hypothetical protein
MGKPRLGAKRKIRRTILGSWSYRDGIGDLEIVKLRSAQMDPSIMGYADSERRYNFTASLEKRVVELKRSIGDVAMVIWPILHQGEDMLLKERLLSLFYIEENGDSGIVRLRWTALGT